MTNSNTYTNHLVNEGSPYLLMHVHNPVDWYAWNDEAWAKARQEDKLVVISIGYAACHWCHVMEHESFSDADVAAIMNEHFVSVKVDREERPDVDQVYMEVAQRLTGRGGWPLNVIALSDGKPVFAGSYYTKSQWVFLLQQLNHLYRSSRDEINEMADGITQDINVNSLVGLHSSQLSYFQLNDLHQIVDEWMSLFDHTYGGLNAVPKFPMPCVYDFLLSYYDVRKDVKILDIVTLTLDQMAMGGIYDQIGGGFARYSTDIYWRVPHFEKMLYDNAQLVSLYAKAFQMSGNPLYKQVVEDTLRFVTAELTSPEYGFYSSLDADSEGEEGKYYAWTTDDLAILSPAEVQLIKDYFNVSEQGNWEQGKNVLYRKTDDKAFCNERGLDILQFSEQLTEVKRKLLHIRNQRSKPALDNKILTSWNALMIEGYIDAYKAIGNPEYLETAVRNARFIADNSMTADRQLFRSFMNGKSSIDAFLDDYAFTIKAFLLLYQVTFEKYWLFKASELAQYTILHFYSNESSLFYYTSDVSEQLIKRNFELFDGVIPSSNSIMAENLYILGEIFLNDDYQKMAQHMLVQLADKLPETGPYGASWLKLMIWFITPPSIIAVVGPDCAAESFELHRMFLPNVLIIGGVNEEDIPYLTHKNVKEKTTFYLCQNRTCGLPVHSVRELVAQISNK